MATARRLPAGEQGGAARDNRAGWRDRASGFVGRFSTHRCRRVRERAEQRGTIVRVTTTAPRLLQVRRCARVTPGMIRVTLAGEELAGFAGTAPTAASRCSSPCPARIARPCRGRARAARCGPRRGPAERSAPTPSAGSTRRPASSTSTSCSTRATGLPRRGRGTPGPAPWVGVSEPGGHYVPDPTVDYHVVIGDETALPAVATVLDAIDPARALTFLEVAEAAEEQALPGAVSWVHRDGRRAGEPLAAAVRRRTSPTAVGRPGSPASRRACGTCAVTSSRSAASTGASSTPRVTGATADRGTREFDARASRSRRDRPHVDLATAARQPDRNPPVPTPRHRTE